MNRTADNKTFASSTSTDASAQLAFQVLEYTVLLLAGYTALVAAPEPLRPKVQNVSLLGYLFPVARFGTPVVFHTLKAFQFVTLLGWLLANRGRASRAVYLVSPVILCLLTSLVVETQFFVHHQPNFCVIAFILLGVVRFIHLSQPPSTLAGGWGGAAEAETGPGRGPDTGCAEHSPTVCGIVLPPWTYFLFLYYISLSYTYSGLTKIWYSGWDWANGSSLMFWVAHFAPYRDTWLYAVITEHFWLAWIMQVVTFFVETFCLVVIFWPHARPIFGLLLVGFHLSVETLFGFHFYANILLDALILIGYYAIPEYRITASDFLRWLTTPSDAQVGKGLSHFARRLSEAGMRSL